MSNYIHGYITRSGFLHGIGVLVLILVGLGSYGWLMSVKLDKIDVVGIENAERDDVIALSRLSSGDRVFHIDRKGVTASIDQHAWIESSHISRFPTGTVRVTVKERIPELVGINDSGEPSFYVDADGFRLPITTQKYYDVPLLRGAHGEVDEEGRLDQASLVQFVRVLSQDVTGVRGMISEVVLDQGEISLRLTPGEIRGAVPVRLGQSSFKDRMEKLRSFWEQRIQTEEEKEIQLIDLRFDSQIVVREDGP